MGDLVIMRKKDERNTTRVSKCKVILSLVVAGVDEHLLLIFVIMYCFQDFPSVEQHQLVWYII